MKNVIAKLQKCRDDTVNEFCEDMYARRPDVTLIKFHSKEDGLERVRQLDSIIKFLSVNNEDTTRPITVIELAAVMLAAPRIQGECVCEVVFDDDAGRRINMECAVTMVDGVPHARQWKPKFSVIKIMNRFWQKVRFWYL